MRHRVSENWLFVIGFIGKFIDETPSESLLCRQPSALFHQVKKSLCVLLALGGVHLCDVGIELIEVFLLLFNVGDERSEVVRVHASPLEEVHRAFMHEVHGACVHGDDLRTE